MKSIINHSYNFIFIIILFISITSHLNAREVIISGNDYSSDNVILSIIGDIPDSDDKTKSNYILKELNNSGLFKSVEVQFNFNQILIKIEEYPSINKIYYTNNERLKDEQIDEIIKELGIFTLSDRNISILTEELTKIYQSFGYNNIKIQNRSEILSNKSANFFLEFNEGKITKIKQINIIGNANFDDSLIRSKIKSKTKKLTNIFANNNFKLFQIENDIIRIQNFYKSEGYKDIEIEFDIEYFVNNKVTINFNINEGDKYYFSSLKIKNELKNNQNYNDTLIDYANSKSNFSKNHYNLDKLDLIEVEISQLLELSGEKFFEIKIFEKINKEKVDILYQILPTKPEYVNQINISGNTRTYDYVIRRELDISEGDPINETKIKSINKKLNRLSLFETVSIEKELSDNESKNLEVIVKETQTGTFNVGLSVGTLDGASFVSGLKERNINGTGRSLEFLINTSEDNRAFTLSTKEKFALNNKIDHKYSTIYGENDFTKSKSYKLHTLNLDTEFNYDLFDNLNHNFGVGYTLKDYIITDQSTVEDNIAKSSGGSIAINIKNELSYSTLNSFIKPTKGNYIYLGNFIESPSSSTNGYIKNTITGKKFTQINDSIYSVQARLGNIVSLNDNEILSDNKFSLGGRWLRGFDNFGAGPRNSRTAYIGGNNLIVTKFDYSRPLTLNEQNPIYLNLFNDYGLLWENKNNVTFSDESLRSSYGFGFNFYSPIGPIGFTWGFPLSDKDYDIKRMFMFTVGNLN